MSLASLTAAYTDSEAEEEQDHDEQKAAATDSDSPMVTARRTQLTSSPDNRSNSSRPTSPIQVRVTSKVAKLVSYHDDDTYVSDGDDDESQSIDARNTLVILEKEENNGGAVEDADEEVADCPNSDDNDVNLPPEPKGTCAIELQEKIQKLHDRMRHEALDMNAVIQQRKDFRNPSIYEKLIQFCSINELGTNYPPSIYNALKWSKESFYEDLAKVQKAEMDKRERDRKSKVEVVSGTKRHEDGAATAMAAMAAAASKKRKSKWDQPGGNGGGAAGGGGTIVAATGGVVIGGQSLKPAGLVQPSLTTNATGTKATVINAFGSLVKKPTRP